MTCHGGLTLKTQWARQTVLLVFYEDTWTTAQSQRKRSHTMLWSVQLCSTPRLSGKHSYKLTSQHWSRCRDKRLTISVMTTMDVTKMIDDLNWEPLEVRRRHERLDMLYRIPFDMYLQVSDSRTRTNQIFQERVSDATYSNSLFLRTVWDWNRLPLPSGDSVWSIPGGIQITGTPLGVICSKTTTARSPVTVYKVLIIFILYIVFLG